MLHKGQKLLWHGIGGKSSALVLLPVPCVRPRRNARRSPCPGKHPERG